MGVKLGYNQYGKAENRVVRVFRDSDPHEIVDYNVSVDKKEYLAPGFLSAKVSRSARSRLARHSQDKCAFLLTDFGTVIS